MTYLTVLGDLLTVRRRGMQPYSVPRLNSPEISSRGCQ